MLKNVKKEKNAFTRIVQDKISASLFYRKIKKIPEFHENIEWSIEEKVNNKKDVWVSWEYRMMYRGEG